MKYIVSARYGVMALIGGFVSRSSEYKRQDYLILKTDRGTEIGKFLAVKGEMPSGSEEETDGKIIGVASDDEIMRMKKIHSVTEKEEKVYCSRLITDRELPMKLKYAEHIFGGERIIFYFTADERVDFRSLVKDLAEKYKTRIEMKQIGARDEALLLEDCGICGRDLCCRSILEEIQPVSMKMAKTQTSTLDPAKVSGRCGRLKCCFRYEHGIYRELSNKLPEIGDVVKTRTEEGEVINVEVLRQKVIISSQENETAEIDSRDIIEVIKK
jgi:cell fate regulator YaaT (PSP1 superfamily)